MTNPESKRNSPLNYALLLLKIRDRGTDEIKVRMKRKGFEPDDIEATVRYLTERGLLDDKKFAERYLKNQLDIKPQGKRRLYTKLKQTFLPNDIIAEVIGSVSGEDEKRLAEDAARRWFSRGKSLSREDIKPRLSRYLVGRGFDWDTVSGVLNKIDKYESND